jgi:hypothetical protein
LLQLNFNFSDYTYHNGAEESQNPQKGYTCCGFSSCQAPNCYQYPSDCRNLLLPYLALGFTPIKTNGGGSLYGINALQRSLKEARIAFNPPDAPKIKNADHIGQADFRELLRSARYNAIVQEHLKETSIHKMKEGPQKKELIDNLLKQKDLDIFQLTLLLRLANE